MTQPKTHPKAAPKQGVLGFKECVITACGAAGRKLTDDELANMYAQLSAEAKKLEAQGMPPAQAMREAGKKLGQQEQIATLIQERNAKLNLIAKRNILARLEGQEDVAGALLAFLQGYGKGRDADRSVFASMKAQMNTTLGPLIADLEEAGLLQILKEQAGLRKTVGRQFFGKDISGFERDVAREMWRLDDPESGADTGNALAKKAATILHEHQEGVRASQNKYGAWIGKRSHYVTRQAHDMWKIRGAGKEADFQKWRDVIEPKLTDEVFEGMDAARRGEYLHNVWQALSSGVHESASGADWLAGFKGPANVAKSASQSRSLIFKSADDWLAYNREFGSGSVLESVFRGIESGARNTAIMRDMGTNPVAMFNKIVEEQRDAAIERGDFTQADKVSKLKDSGILRTVTGEALKPWSKTLSVVGAGTRAWNQIISLGMTTLSSIPDLAVLAAAARHNGVPLLEAYRHSLFSLVPSLLKSGARERRQIARLLGIGIQGTLESVGNRFCADDAVVGTMSALVGKFHTINGLEYWTDSLSEGFGMMLSHNLARESEKAFGKLDPKFQRTLSYYGIEEAEWQALKHMPKRAADGTDYLLPTEVHKIDDAHLEHLTTDSRTADHVRDTLQQKLQTYIIDQMRSAMTEPDAWMANIVSGAPKRLDNAGHPLLAQAMRCFMQFKMYPMTMGRRTWMREIKRAPSFDPRTAEGRDSLGDIVHFIAMTTLLGYVAMSLKALATGRKPRDPTDWRTVMAAMTQGGGAGIYGDFLFGQASRTGNPIGENLTGPTVANIGNLLGVVIGSRDLALDRLGGDDDAPSQHSYLSSWIRLIEGNLPGHNLFYLNLALKYGVFYQLQELVNPGYLQRFERNVNQHQGQQFWLSPSHPLRDLGFSQ